MIVVDTNVIAYLFIKGDYTKSAEKLLKMDADWISPVLWKSEFRSVVSKYLKQNEFSLEYAKSLVTLAEKFMQGREYNIDANLLLEIFQQSKCSSYDCEFITLAKSHDLILYTSDKRLIHEFPTLTRPLQDI